MPYTLHPVEALPPKVDEAYEMVRSATRIAIIRWLGRHPGSLVSEIVAGVGGQRITTRSHLEVLESIGAIVTDHAPGARERMRVRYSVQPDRITELTDRLRRHLVDDSDR